MTYDQAVDERYEKQDREHEAELRRAQREAARAFEAASASPTRPARRCPAFSAERRAQVSHARAVVAALAGFTYDGTALQVAR